MSDKIFGTAQRFVLPLQPIPQRSRLFYSSLKTKRHETKFEQAVSGHRRGLHRHWLCADSSGKSGGSNPHSCRVRIDDSGDNDSEK